MKLNYILKNAQVIANQTKSKSKCDHTLNFRRIKPYIAKETILRPEKNHILRKMRMKIEIERKLFSTDEKIPILGDQNIEIYRWISPWICVVKCLDLKNSVNSLVTGTARVAGRLKIPCGRRPQVLRDGLCAYITHIKNRNRNSPPQ